MIRKAALALMLLAPAFSPAQSPTKVPEPKISCDPRSYICYRAAAPIVIDGNIDEAVWDKTSWSDAFLDIEGTGRPKPRFRTMVKMLWDDEYFYIAGYLEEPHIWATLTQRDSIIYLDNDFEVFIDPDGDTHNYYELEMNALNTVWDLLLIRPYRDGGPAIHAWDIKGLKTAVKLNGTLNDPRDKDKGLFVEIALPWNILKEAAVPKSAPKAGDRWRMDFSRVEYRMDVKNGQYSKTAGPDGKPLAEDNWVWAPTGLINIHYPEMWGFVQFSGRVAGQGRDSFQEKPEDDVKWALRRIYYGEWALKAAKGAFSADWRALGLKEKDLKVKEYMFPPVIQTTETLFEAVYKSQDGGVWRITQDGRVVKDS